MSLLRLLGDERIEELERTLIPVAGAAQAMRSNGYGGAARERAPWTIGARTSVRLAMAACTNGVELP